jgi:hypothetical protein
VIESAPPTVTLPPAFESSRTVPPVASPPSWPSEAVLIEAFPVKSVPPVIDKVPSIA